MEKSITLYNGGIIIGIFLLLIAWAIDMKNYPPKDPKSHWPSYPKASVSRTYVSPQPSNSVSLYTSQTECEEENKPSYFEKWQEEQKQKEEYKKAHTKVMKFNPYTAKYEYAYPDQILKFNAYTAKYEWAYPDEEPQYNWETGEWEY